MFIFQQGMIEKFIIMLDLHVLNIWVAVIIFFCI